MPDLSCRHLSSATCHHAPYHQTTCHHAPWPPFELPYLQRQALPPVEMQTPWSLLGISSSVNLHTAAAWEPEAAAWAGPFPHLLPAVWPGRGLTLRISVSSPGTWDNKSTCLKGMWRGVNGLICAGAWSRACGKPAPMRVSVMLLLRGRC